MIYYFTTGDYEDYRVIGVYEGPAGVSLKAAAEEFAALHPDKWLWRGRDNANPDEDEFMAFVARKYSLHRVESAELVVSSLKAMLMEPE